VHRVEPGVGRLGDLQQEDLSTDLTQVSSALPPLNSLIIFFFVPEPASEVDLLMSLLV
jgi:hypothetical protein